MVGSCFIHLQRGPSSYTIIYEEYLLRRISDGIVFEDIWLSKSEWLETDFGEEGVKGILKEIEGGKASSLEGLYFSILRVIRGNSVTTRPHLT